MATSTPWGAAQYSHVYARGIVQYGTASHGGIHLSKTRVEAMNPVLRGHIKALGCIKSAGDAWLEEDCEMAFAVVAFPETFKPEYLESAEKTLRGYYPDQWEEFYGRKLQPGESPQRDKEMFYAKHANDIVAFSYYGDHYENVPTGQVACECCVGGWEKRSGQEHTFWLVDKAECDADRQFGFVIDPTRHVQMSVPPGDVKRKVA